MLRPFYQCTPQRILEDNTSTDTVLSHVFHFIFNYRNSATVFYPTENMHPQKKGHSFEAVSIPNSSSCNFFYICGSVHRNSRLKKSNEMQEYADIYLPLNYPTCFGRPSRPSSEVHKTVSAASGTDHTVWGLSFLLKRSPYLVTFGENLLHR